MFIGGVVVKHPVLCLRIIAAAMSGFPDSNRDISINQVSYHN